MRRCSAAQDGKYMTTSTSPAASVVSDSNSAVRSRPMKAEDSSNTDSEQRLLLIQGCLFSLSQCELLLNRVSQESFVLPVGNSTIGAHVRHVLDRFQCFLHGLPRGEIDYDARKRDVAIASSLEAAALALATVSTGMQALCDAPYAEPDLTVRESVYHQSPAVTIGSSPQRELMGLITHTTHHLAIIALLAKGMGYQLDDDFGKAASTIRYERTGK